MWTGPYSIIYSFSNLFMVIIEFLQCSSYFSCFPQALQTIVEQYFKKPANALFHAIPVSSFIIIWHNQCQLVKNSLINQGTTLDNESIFLGWDQ